MQRRKMLVSVVLLFLLAGSIFLLMPSKPVKNPSDFTAHKAEVDQPTTDKSESESVSAQPGSSLAAQSRADLQSKSAKLAAERKAIFAVDPAKPDWELIEAALQSENHATRYMAVNKLSQVQSRKSLLMLIRAVRDMNTTVANGAVSGIEKLCGYQLPVDRPLTQLGRNAEADLVLRWLTKQSGKTLLAMRRENLKERSG